MIEFKVGQTVQASDSAYPDRLRGLRGAIRETDRDIWYADYIVFFPDFEAEEADSEVWQPGSWPMFASELEAAHE